MSLQMFVPDTEADVLRRRRLRRMQAVATGLLLFPAIVFFATQSLGGFGRHFNTGA